MYNKNILAIALFCLPVTSLVAQVSGRLSGTVVDASNAAVPNAKVSITIPGGTAAAFETETNSSGGYSINSARPDQYDLVVEKNGFRKYTQRGVKIDPGVETVLQPVKLDVGSVAETVDVTETITAVQTTNAEVTSTVTTAQVQSLPQLNRSLVALFQTQLGVTLSRNTTVIDGQRNTFSAVTLDGVNIQDNLFRENGLDFQPNRLTQEQVNEFTVSSSNSNSTVGGGSSQITLSTRSGTSEYHGAVYWYWRNNALAAGDWFNNRDGLPNQFLNQNQPGASFGGPIKKNKLFFYANYEALRRSQQTSLNRTILTDSARQGIFTYAGTGGAIQRSNILQIAGVTINSNMSPILAQIPGQSNINNFRVGDSTAALARNTGGYSFQARNNAVRDNVTGKLDYVMSAKNTFTVSYLWNRNSQDRNDAGIANDYSVTPKVTNDSNIDFLAASWRTNPIASLTNELRGGFNYAPAPFGTSQDFPAAIVDFTYVANPLNIFRAQGRSTHTYNLSDTASYQRGTHNFQFGFQLQQVKTAPYNDAGITPTYTIGIGTGNTGLTTAQLPGISANDLNNANNLLALLAGYVMTDTQTFNVTSRTSGFVKGATDLKNYLLNNYAFFGQDTWRIRPRLTLTLGLRYELFGVVDERDGLGLLPVGTGNPIATLTNPNGTLDFAGAAAGRPFYNRDKNNFAPNIGLAWDVFGTGKTAVRAGYGISYANDNHIAAIRNSVVTNAGLAQTVSATGLKGTVSALPAITTPAFKVPRTYADNWALSTAGAFAMPDPNLRTPYIQTWNFSIQQKVKDNVIEVRYVGNHGVKLFRGYDFNQVEIIQNGFLPDFLRAYNNGNLARARTGAFNPTYDPNIPGSQPLTVFPLLPSGGSITGATNVGLIQRGEVGELANSYQTTRLNGPINFYRNPNALGNNLMTSSSNSTFNALQVEFTRRLFRGMQFQANYNWSKVLSDSLGDGQARFEAALDNGNQKIERARAPFDLTHQFKANGVWELPFGSKHRLGKDGVNWLIGGWSVSSTMIWQSGSPFSILSTRGTLNRQARSLTTNTANTSLTGDQLDSVVGFFMTGTGPMFINPANIGKDGRGAAPDGTPAFQGQAFTDPGPGTLGALQRRMFSGPSAFNLNMGILKAIKITERQSLDIRGEFFNLPNHPTFTLGDESLVTADRNRVDINQPNFGVISSMNLNFDRRIIQFGAYYHF